MREKSSESSADGGVQEVQLVNGWERKKGREAEKEEKQIFWGERDKSGVKDCMCY